MRNFKTRGIIIKRRNSGEADKILTVLTQEQGKIQIKATGIRRIPSRRSAHVELLNYAQLTLYKGPGYPILTEAVTVESFSGIKDDLTKVGYAYHLCELIDKLCPENQESQATFPLLKNALIQLCCIAENSSISPLIHKFEIELLTTLGYWDQAEIASESFDTGSFIENIIEKKLKSRNIFTRM